MTISLRTTVEALILGTAGTTRTMAAGRFRLSAPDGDVDDDPRFVADRTFKVVLDSPEPLDGFNSLDTFVMYRQRMTVRITYLVTHAGGDLVESVSQGNSGSGEIDDIRDRSNTDAHDLNVVLGWHENYAGTDPRIVTIQPEGPPSGPNINGTLAIFELPFLMITKATVPGAYAP